MFELHNLTVIKLEGTIELRFAERNVSLLEFVENHKIDGFVGKH